MVKVKSAERPMRERKGQLKRDSWRKQLSTPVMQSVYKTQYSKCIESTQSVYGGLMAERGWRFSVQKPWSYILKGAGVTDKQAVDSGLFNRHVSSPALYLKHSTSPDQQVLHLSVARYVWNAVTWNPSLKPSVMLLKMITKLSLCCRNNYKTGISRCYI